MDKETAYLQETNCPVCGSDQREKRFMVNHRQSSVLNLLNLEENRPVDIVRCNHCGHQYMNPIIRPDLMNRYYSIVNSEFYHNAHKDTANINAKEYINYSQAIKKVKPGGKVLEIGCGNGYLLKTLADHGFECYGVEPSPLAYQHASQKLGLNVENAFLSGSTYYKEKFDVVIFIDVAEHITDMNAFMLEVNQVMEEGGLLFIGTGNIGSLNARVAGADWGYFLSWEHVSFFDKKSMATLLNKHQYADIRIKETSLQHKPLQNIFEFAKNLFKKLVNPFLKNKFYHGITFDHFIITAIKTKSESS